MKASIIGIGWVTAGGRGRGGGGTPFSMADGPVAAPARREVFPEPDQRYGRMDKFSKVGLAAIAFALEDAGLAKWETKRPLGIIVSSALGCLATDVDYFKTVMPQEGLLASPNLFAYTLPNTFLGEAAIRFGLTGPTFVASAGEGGGGLAVLTLALESIAWGDAEAMLAGVCDLPAPHPYDGISPTVPGAVFLVLSGARSLGVRNYGDLVLDGGKLLHSGKAVTGLDGLAAACLAEAARRGSGA